MSGHRTEACIAPEHPCMAGHFPGNPIVPGVVLLDCVAAAVREVQNLRIRGVPNLKFVQPLRPGVRFTIHWTTADRRLRFRCESGAADAPQLHVQGVFSFDPLPDNAGPS